MFGLGPLYSGYKLVVFVMAFSSFPHTRFLIDTDHSDLNTQTYQYLAG